MKLARLQSLSNPLAAPNLLHPFLPPSPPALPLETNLSHTFSLLSATRYILYAGTARGMESSAALTLRIVADPPPHIRLASVPGP